MIHILYPSLLRVIVGAVLALMSFLPIQSTCHRLRVDRSLQDKGSPASTFLSALILMVGTIFYPMMLLALPVQWMVYHRFHLLTWRSWLASITAVAMVILYLEIYHFYTTHLCTNILPSF